MASVIKPTEQAFILDPAKADIFLSQDNNQVKKLMEKIERLTKGKESISREDK